MHLKPWIFKTLLGLLAAFAALPASGQNAPLTKVPKWYIPGHVRLQLAGQTGAAAVGFGYAYAHNKIETSLLYGYLPGREYDASIHTLSVKNLFVIRQFPVGTGNLMQAFAGFDVNIVFRDNDHTFLISLPNQFPDNYYSPNSIRFAPNFGARYYHPLKKQSFVKGWDIYLEWVTNDIYIKNLIKSEYLKVTEIFSLGLGFSLHLR